MCRLQRKRIGRASISALFWNGYPQLSRRLTRYYLAIALFQPPLSERSVTVSESRALSSGHSCRFKAASDAQRHLGSPHYAYRMAVDRLTTCAPCRVRGQVLIAQEHQPLPTERSMHPFDALRSPRVPSLVSQCGRYAMSDSFMLSYFP